jgi:hypothetical protein
MAAALRALAIMPFEPLRFSAAVQASLLNRLRCSRLNACAVNEQGHNCMATTFATQSSDKCLGAKFGAKNAANPPKGIKGSLTNMKEIITTIAGLASVVTALVGVFLNFLAPMRKVQDGHHQIYMLFAFVSAVILFCIPQNDTIAQYTAIIVNPLVCYIAGGLFLYVFILFGSKFHASPDSNRWLFTAKIALYCFAVGIIALGISQQLTESNAVTVEGSVQFDNDNGSRVYAKFKPVLLRTKSCKQLSTYTNYRGKYRFFIDKECKFTVGQVSVCDVHGVNKFVQYFTHDNENDVLISVENITLPGGNKCGIF